VTMRPVPKVVPKNVYQWDTMSVGGYQGGNGRWSEAKWCADNSTRRGVAVGEWKDMHAAYVWSGDRPSNIIVDQDVVALEIKTAWTPWTRDFSMYGPLPYPTNIHHRAFQISCLRNLEIGNGDGNDALDATYQYWVSSWLLQGPTARLIVGGDLIISRFVPGRLSVTDGWISVFGNLRVASPGFGDFRTVGFCEIEGGTVDVGNDLTVGWLGGIDQDRLGSRPEGHYVQRGGSVSVGNMLIVSPSDLGGYNAGGGQTYGTADLVIWDGSLTVGRGVIINQATSTFSPIQPSLEINGGVVTVNGMVTVNSGGPLSAFNRMSLALLSMSNGTLLLNSMSLVARPSNVMYNGRRVGSITPYGNVELSGGVMTIRGDLSNGGGVGMLNMLGGQLVVRGDIICRMGVMKIFLNGGPGSVDLRGSIQVEEGASMLVSGNTPVNLQTGIVVDGDLDLETDVTLIGPTSAGPGISGRGTVNITGASIDMQAKGIRGIKTLRLAGSLVNAGRIVADRFVVAGGNASINAGTGTTQLQGQITRELGATLSVSGRVFFTIPPRIRYGILPPWVVLGRSDFAAYNDNVGPAPLRTYENAVGLRDRTKVAQFFSDANLQASVDVYALKLGIGVFVRGLEHNVSIGNGGNVAGLILEAGSNIRVNTLHFDCTDDAVLHVFEGLAEVTAPVVTTNRCGLTKSGPGVLTLNGDVSGVHGPISLSAGGLTLGAAKALDDHDVVVPDGSNGVLRLSGFSVVLRSLTLGASPMAVIENSGRSSATLTAKILSNQIYHGTLRDGVEGSGPLKFVKSGNGTLRLERDFSATGGLGILGGALQISQKMPDVPLTIGSGSSLFMENSEVFTQPVAIVDEGGFISAPFVTFQAPIEGPGALGLYGGEFELQSSLNLGGFSLGKANLGATFKVTPQSTFALTANPGQLKFDVAVGEFQTAILDLTPIPSFVADVRQINIGVGKYQQGSTGIIRLSNLTNDITVRERIVVAAYGIDNAQWPPPSRIVFGPGDNAVHTPLFLVGTSQGVALVTIAPGGRLRLDNGGDNGADVIIAQGIYDSNRYTVGELNLQGGIVDLRIRNLIIGQGERARVQFPLLLGTFSMSGGRAVVENVILGICRELSRGRGKLYVFGGEMIVGDGGIFFDSSIVGSGFSLIWVEGTGLLRLGGTNTTAGSGDIVIGPLESGAKGFHQIRLREQGVLDFNGHSLRFTNQRSKVFRVDFEGGEIRNAAFLDTRLYIRFGTLAVTSVNTTVSGVVTVSRGGALHVAANRRLTIRNLACDDRSAAMYIAGTLEVLGQGQDTAYAGLVSGNNAVIIKEGGSTLAFSGSARFVGQVRLVVREGELRFNTRASNALISIDVFGTGTLKATAGLLVGTVRVGRGGILNADMTVSGLTLSGGALIDVQVQTDGTADVVNVVRRLVIEGQATLRVSVARSALTSRDLLVKIIDFNFRGATLVGDISMLQIETDSSVGSNRTVSLVSQGNALFVRIQ